jgi:hypothetical protein
VKRLHHVAAHHVVLGVAGQLEDAAAEREDPALGVADDEAGRRRRVVVVHQLEEEPEAAAAARHGLSRHAFEAVQVDRALLAVRADVVRHESIVATARAIAYGGSRRPARP